MEKSQTRAASDDKSVAAMAKKFSNARVPPSDFMDNLSQFIKLSQTHKFQLIFYIPYVIHPLYRRLIYLVASENKIPVEDFSGQHEKHVFDDLIANPAYAQLLKIPRENLGDDFFRKNRVYVLTVDGLHPNALGNRLVAEEISKLIRINLDRTR
jgi:lysophospholipase L1-like esterase